MKNTELRSSLDRLVTGDLGEPERAGLIQFLEEYPEHWRDCGLAFLEAQLWSETLHQIQESATVAVSGRLPEAVTTSVGPSFDLQKQPSRYWAQFAAVALILLAFAGGRFVERNLQPAVITTADVTSDELNKPATDIVRPRSELAAPTINPEPRTSSGLTPSSIASQKVEGARAYRQQIPFALTTSDSGAPQIQISEYQKQLLARRGVAVATQRHYLNTRLPDGRQVAVPIEQVVVQRQAGELN